MYRPVRRSRSGRISTLLTSTPLAISTARRSFLGRPPIVTWRPNRRLNTQALRINASGESSAPVNPFEAWKPAGLTVARCSRARFRGRCHPEPTLPAPGFFWVKICMRIVTESVAIFFSPRGRSRGKIDIFLTAPRAVVPRRSCHDSRISRSFRAFSRPLSSLFPVRATRVNRRRPALPTVDAR